MGHFNHKISIIGLSLSMLISIFAFADEIDVENSIEPALITVIVKSENLDAFCTEQNCSKSSSLFVEDETGTKSTVPGLVQVTYFKSFGYEPAPGQIVTAVSRQQLDVNTPDYSLFQHGQIYTTMSPDTVDAFCHQYECFYIGPVRIRPTSGTLDPLQVEEYVRVGYWDIRFPGPDDPKPGEF